MAIILKPDGEKLDVEPRDPRGGFSLLELHTLIGCTCIDITKLFDGRLMVVDDNGHARKQPINPRATRLYRTKRNTDWEIRGTAVVCGVNELR